MDVDKLQGCKIVVITNDGARNVGTLHTLDKQSKSLSLKDVTRYENGGGSLFLEFQMFESANIAKLDIYDDEEDETEAEEQIQQQDNHQQLRLQPEVVVDNNPNPTSTSSSVPDANPTETQPMTKVEKKKENVNAAPSTYASKTQTAKKSLSAEDDAVRGGRTARGRGHVGTNRFMDEKAKKKHTVSRANPKSLKFDQDFDFASANKKFQKLEEAMEGMSLKGKQPKESTDEVKDGDVSAEDKDEDLTDIVEIDIAYNKSDSFFDSLSSQNVVSGDSQHNDYERKSGYYQKSGDESMGQRVRPNDYDTFGQDSVQQHFRYQRDNYRGRGRGRGRGQGSYYDNNRRYGNNSGNGGHNNGNGGHNNNRRNGNSGYNNNNRRNSNKQHQGFNRNNARGGVGKKDKTSTTTTTATVED